MSVLGLNPTGQAVRDLMTFSLPTLCSSCTPSDLTFQQAQVMVTLRVSTRVGGSGMTSEATVPLPVS